MQSRWSNNETVNTRTKMRDTATAIRKLSVHHKEFIDIVKSLSGNNQSVRNYAEDYVQEGYLRLMRYGDLYEKVIDDEGKATKGYMFFVLRSIMINDLKKKSNLGYNFLGDQYDIEEKYMLEETPREAHRVEAEAIEAKMYNLIAEAADNPDVNLDRFDALTFNLYLSTRKSYAKMSKESGVGERTIYLSMTRCKQYIYDNLKDDYDHYLSRFLIK